jgi:hypothetical protein
LANQYVAGNGAGLMSKEISYWRYTSFLIYGVTFTIAKDVMPRYIDAYGFILLRVGGSVILFWLVWLLPKKVLTDFPRIIAAAFFGVAFNMLTF